jgi:predicted DNA-binding transcriptional regulator YafY
LTGLTVPETRAIFMAGLPGPAAELGLGDAMATAQLKLLAALPADWRADAQQVSARFHLDAIDWFRSAAPPPQLHAVAGAVWQCRRVALRYESWQGERERTVEPLGLVLKAGTWYMAARRAGREAHVYRVAAIRALDVLDETFTRPRDFDLADWWARETVRFEAGVYRGEARLAVNESGLGLVQSFSAIVAAAALDSAEPSATQEGRIEIRIPIESIAHAARQLLRLGDDGEVLGPPELRAALARTYRQLERRYRDTV